MRFDDAARNRQAQARPAALEFRLAGRMERDLAGLVELLEDQLVVGRVNADARIADHHLYPLWLAGPFGRQPLTRNRDLAAIGGIFDRIDDQLAKHLAQLVCIRLDGRQAFQPFHLKAQLALLQRAVVLLVHHFHHVEQGSRLFEQRQGLVGDLRNIQHAVDHLQHAVRAADNAVYQLFYLRVGYHAGMRLGHLGVPAGDGQRGAQLVGGHVDEGRFILIQPLQVMVGAVQLLGALLHHLLELLVEALDLLVQVGILKGGCRLHGEGGGHGGIIFHESRRFPPGERDHPQGAAF